MNYVLRVCEGLRERILKYGSTARGSERLAWIVGCRIDERVHLISLVGIAEQAIKPIDLAIDAGRNFLSILHHIPMRHSR